MKLKVTLGDRDISNLIDGTLDMTAEVQPGAIRRKATFRVAADPNQLFMLDWALPVTAVLDSAEGVPERVFSGLVERAEPDRHGGVSVSLSDPSVILHEATTGGAFGSGIAPPEILYYLVASVMPGSIDPKGFPFDQRSSLADRPELSFPRMFSFVAPLLFVEAPREPLPFLDGLVYAGSADASYDERAIASAHFKEPVEEWAEGKARIRFVVQANGFLQAFEEGLVRLRKALDVIALAANTSGAVLPGSANGVLGFDRSRVNNEVREPDWLFVRDNLPGRSNRHWLRWYAPHLGRTGLHVSEPHFREFEEFMREIAGKSDNLLTARERSLLNAIHTLRKSRQASYESDGLSLLWQAVEYLVAGFPAEPPVSIPIAKLLLSRCIDELEALDPKPPRAQLEEMEKHVRRCMNLVRSLPLKDKWQAACRDFGLDFSEDEDELLWKLRGARNDELHGSKSMITRSDVHRALSMVEKAVLVGVQKARSQIASNRT